MSTVADPPGSDGPAPDPAGLDVGGFEVGGFAVGGFDLEVLDQIEGDLSEVDAAIARIDDGRYGRCDACGAVIDDAVLAGRPMARRCQAHGGGDASRPHPPPLPHPHSDTVAG